jgi:L-lactate utilization protein LutC
MSCSIDEAIKDIAVKHGVSLDRNDPILMVQTMHERLLIDAQHSQEQLLAKFKEEIELVSSRWQDDAKDKAENILNAALHSANASMEKILINAATEHCQAIKKEHLNLLDEIRSLNHESKKASRFTLYACSVLLITSCLFVVAMLII